MTVKMHDGQQKYHVYVQDPDNTMTFLASGPKDWAMKHARMYLEKHEMNPQAQLVIARVDEEIDVDDFIMRSL